MSVRKSDNPELYAKIEQQNLLRQYDLLLNCIEIGLDKGIEAFDKYTLWTLNAAAVSNIAQFGGRFPRGAHLCRESLSSPFQGRSERDGSILLSDP